jgi:hypothetical protein
MGHSNYPRAARGREPSFVRMLVVPCLTDASFVGEPDHHWLVGHSGGMRRS